MAKFKISAEYSFQVDCGIIIEANDEDEAIELADINGLKWEFPLCEECEKKILTKPMLLSGEHIYAEEIEG